VLNRVVKMEEDNISKFLKYLFLASGLAAFIFGITFILFVEVYYSLLNWPYQDPLVARVLGAALIGLGILQWLSYREKRWENVKNLVIMMIVWHVLGAIVTISGQFLFNLPLGNLVHVIVFIVFSIAYLYAFFLQR
jgi:hypothetical protein